MYLIRSCQFIGAGGDYLKQKFMPSTAAGVGKLGEQAFMIGPELVTVVHTAGRQNLDAVIHWPFSKPRANVRFLTQCQREHTRLLNGSANPHIIIRSGMER